MKSRYVFAPALAAMLAASTSVLAQQDEISTEQVQQYFGAVQQEVTEIIPTADGQRLIEWTDRNIGEGVNIHASAEVLHNGARKLMVFLLEREDLVQLRSLMAGAVEQEDLIGDYDLEIAVDEVISHGPQAATVRATWSDRGSLSPRPMGNEAEPSPDDVDTTFVRSFDCSHVLHRADDQFRIGMTNCSGRVNTVLPVQSQ